MDIWTKLLEQMASFIFVVAIMAALIVIVGTSIIVFFIGRFKRKGKK